MKYIIISILYFLLPNPFWAQQEVQYSYFTEAKQIFNPAVAGENKFTSLTLMYRSQWAGIDGAPESQFIAANLKAFKQHGLAFSFNRAAIGIQERLGITAQYAYKVRLNKSIFSIGLQFSQRQYSTDYSQSSIIALDGFDNDPLISNERITGSVFNIGVGIYLKSKSYFIGLSAPRMIRSSIINEIANNNSIEERHINLMAGVDIKINQNWKFKPALNLKYVNNAPFSLDILQMLEYQNKITLGAEFRAGGSENSIINAANLLVGFNFTSRIFSAIVFDFTLNELKDYENGTVEFILKYHFRDAVKSRNMQNPRFY